MNNEALESLGFSDLFDDFCIPANEGIADIGIKIRDTVKIWIEKIIQAIKTFFATHITKLRMLLKNKQFESILNSRSGGDGRVNFRGELHSIQISSKICDETGSKMISFFRTALECLDNYIEWYGSPDRYSQWGDKVNRKFAFGIPTNLEANVQEVVDELTNGVSVKHLSNTDDGDIHSIKVKDIVITASLNADTIFKSAPLLMKLKDELLKSVEKANKALSNYKYDGYNDKESDVFAYLQNEMKEITKIVNFELISVDKFLSTGYKVYGEYLKALLERVS